MDPIRSLIECAPLTSVWLFGNGTLNVVWESGVVVLRLKKVRRTKLDVYAIDELIAALMKARKLLKTDKPRLSDVGSLRIHGRRRGS